MLCFESSVKSRSCETSISSAVIEDRTSSEFSVDTMKKVTLQLDLHYNDLLIPYGNQMQKNSELERQRGGLFWSDNKVSHLTVDGLWVIELKYRGINLMSFSDRSY